MTAGPARGTRDERIAELFDQHYQGLCRLAVVLLGDPGRAEEVVQEAFVRTYAGWSRIRRPERAQWYLRRAVVNGCRSAARRRVTEDRGNRILAVVDEGGEDEEERAGRVQSVLQAVRALPPRQREAVVLRYYEDLPEATIAATLGCSVGTVKSQLSKARARLARDLGDREEVDGV
jgi:RNA polymerase sigma-70 factor (sigma-E family)